MAESLIVTVGQSQSGGAAFDILGLVFALGHFFLGADSAIEAANAEADDAGGVVFAVERKDRPAERLNPQIDPENERLFEQF